MPPLKLREKQNKGYLRDPDLNPYRPPLSPGRRARTPSPPSSPRRRARPPLPPSPPYAPAYIPESPPYAPAYIPESPPYAPAYVPESPPYAPAVGAQTTTTKRIRFYDDNNGHITAVNQEYGDTIEGFLVHQNPLMNCHTGLVVNTLRGYEAYIKDCGGWELDGEDSDLGALLQMYSNIRDSHEEVSQALTETDMDDLHAWAASLPDNPGRVLKGKVFFDWDQVLNHIEGMYVHPTIEQVLAQGIAPSGYLKLCMGSKARMIRIKQLVSFLFAHSIEVNIVTNNGSCRNDDLSAVFGYVSDVLDPRIQVHCCNTYAQKADCIRARNVTNGVAFGKARKGKGMLLFSNQSRA